MKKRIVTIGRQYGSGGRQIGQLVANKLGVKCYDRTLIGLAAKASGLDPEKIECFDEKKSGLFFVPISIAHYTGYTESNFEYSLNDKIFFLESDIIQKIAERESAVIVGRCADYVLANRDDVLNVFIYADLNNRIRQTADRQFLEIKYAENLVSKTDKQRSNYYKYYTGNKWGENSNYDLTLDSGLGYDKIADIIIKALN